MVRFGTVSAFDVARGLGEVEADDGQRLPFHCTAIADGSRTIPVGARVAFEPAAGHRGLSEARQLVRLQGGEPAPPDAPPAPLRC